MGINSKCYLPNDVRAEDIVTAIAFLCGVERISEPLGSGSLAAWTNRKEASDEPNKKASHVFVMSTHNMQYYTVHVAPTSCDDEWHEGSLFLYPSLEYPNRILLYAGVSRFWQEIDRALVDFFGGEIDDNDCDSVDVDYEKQKPRTSNCPNDGDEWDEFQQGLLDLPKLFEFVD